MADSATLWRNANFLRVWGAEAIRQLGGQITSLAVPLTAIIVLDATVIQVALLRALAFAPLLTLPWIVPRSAGHLLPRRTIVAAEFARAITLACIAVLYVAGLLTFWHLIAAVLLERSFISLFDVEYEPYLTSVVPDNMRSANVKLEMSRSGAQVVGPGMAGIIISALTAPISLAVAATAFAGSGTLLWRARLRRSMEDIASSTRAPRPTALRASLNYMLKHSVLRANLAFVALFNFTTQSMFAIFLVYAVRELGLSVLTIGLVYSIGNLGFLASKRITAPLVRHVPVGWILIASAAIGGFSMLALPAAPPSWTAAALICGFFGFSLAALTYNSVGISVTDALTPSGMVRAANTSRRLVVWGIMPLGCLAGGLLASAVGLRTALWIGAIGASLAFVPLVLSPLRALVEIPVGSREDPAISSRTAVARHLMN